MRARPRPAPPRSSTSSPPTGGSCWPAAPSTPPVWASRAMCAWPPRSTPRRRRSCRPRWPPWGSRRGRGPRTPPARRCWPRCLFRHTAVHIFQAACHIGEAALGNVCLGARGISGSANGAGGFFTHCAQGCQSARGFFRSFTRALLDGIAGIAGPIERNRHGIAQRVTSCSCSCSGHLASANGLIDGFL